MPKLAIAMLLLALAACATTSPPEPVVRTVEVKVPVVEYVACLKEGDVPPIPGRLGDQPYPTNQNEREGLLAAKVAELRGWAERVFPLLQTCQKPPPRPRQ